MRQPTEVRIALRVNGDTEDLTIDPRVTLLDALRERLGLTDTKKGCDRGQCGAWATHASDVAVVLVALDASVRLRGAAGIRTVRLADFYRLPGQTPERENDLAPGELITDVLVPHLGWAHRSGYLKIRDRESYEFALCSAAVALGVRDGVIADARIALGGVGTVPWRMSAAEAALRGSSVGQAAFESAAQYAADGMETLSENGFKPTLAKRTIVRALMGLAA